ncbi:MAG: glycosyltransferase family 2 protein [Bacteroidales bacterium]|nr:glycosyltransferase family 2 protein [Bacteroidales bacterium]
MQIDGFTYVRNGIKMGYPFIPSIKSILPIVDQLFVVVGDSDDGTREAVEAIGNKKIVIIDSIWDDEMRKNGQVFREQANIGLRNSKADWLIHIQADEVILEDSRDAILEGIKEADKNPEVDGLLFPYYHFWGDYNHIRHTRRTHNFEIRAFKNNRNIMSYKDSQGFRIFKDGDEDGVKLKVIKVPVQIFHYSYTRHPQLMSNKSNYFNRFWHNNDWLKENKVQEDFDFNAVDKLEVFEAKHPGYMKETIAQKNWDFVYDPSKSNMSLKDKFHNKWEKIFGNRLFAYKNYILAK